MIHSADDITDHLQHAQPLFFTPVVLVFISLMIGILLANLITISIYWFFIPLVLFVAAYYHYLNRMYRVTSLFLLFVLIILSSIYFTVRTQYVSDTHISKYVNSSPKLVQIIGRVDSKPRITEPAKGAFKNFTYRQPGTSFFLHVNQIQINNRYQPSSGNLYVKINQSEHRIKQNASVQLTGWLQSFAPRANPGDVDFPELMRNGDVYGVITLESREHWQASRKEPVTFINRFQQFRFALANYSLNALAAGFDPDSPLAVSLLRPILLGDWTQTDRTLTEQYRRVGLSHILSISGAHLAILLGITWLIGITCCSHPRNAAFLVLFVLSLYLTVLPIRVPILRASIMAACFLFGTISGRPIRAINAWAFAGIISVIINPIDVFTPGFQLSFAIVAALLIFTDSLTRRIYQSSSRHPSIKQLLLKRLVDYFSVSLMAFCVALPFVIYHFQIVSPVAIFLSILAIPFLSIVIVIGLAKIICFTVLPSASVFLADILRLIVDVFQYVIMKADALPFATLQMKNHVVQSWIAFLLVISLLLIIKKNFPKRIIVPALILPILLMYIFNTNAILGVSISRQASDQNLHLYMYSVGDGTCILIRHRDQNFVFDCGSSSFYELASKSIVPSMQMQGINKIQNIIVSHADIDHYLGVLDLVDLIPVEAVIVSPQLLEKSAYENSNNLKYATSYLINQLRQKQIPIQSVAKGGALPVHRNELSNSNLQVQVLWPPVTYAPKQDNDTSIVLKISFANKNILLVGDIGQDAIEHIQQQYDLSDVDVLELPHHGSYNSASESFVTTIAPSVVLQSSGRKRLQNDPWPALLENGKTQRYVTAKHGMIHLTITPLGEINTTTFIK
ncbi:ComEC family competence protein [Poriferisphaera corsica]|uniref:ComEC family competence protein n=1 Tax=Poriferisphaera corsica TaxID=2528020 RepID=A0A517YWV1_9BACT|nr:ComEC/Rec2 family competence protein [Poriferisphaera corsica]QDU34713.1 ComEC family competence protein [Poriferisphaera corsica]